MNPVFFTYVKRRPDAESRGSLRTDKSVDRSGSDAEPAVIAAATSVQARPERLQPTLTAAQAEQY